MTATFADATANAMMEVLAGLGVYVSLHSANPGSTGASELSGDGYARKAISFDPASDQAIANDDLIAFGPASAEWEEATYYGLWSAVSGGTFIAGAELNDPVTVPNLGEASFATGALIMSLKALA